MKNVLDINNLSIEINTEYGKFDVIRGISFFVKKGEVLAVVGESGCGKSILFKGIMRLLPENISIKDGSIVLGGRNITNYNEKNMTDIRGSEMSMILQNPSSSLNPTMTVGRQIAESLAKCRHLKKTQLKEEVIRLMNSVEIHNAEDVYNMYPYELSGGMCQRCVIAISLAQSPEIIFADEPTSSLDVTIQAQIMKVLKGLKEKNISMVMASHNLSVVAGIADRVAIMYAGRIVEIGTTDEIYYSPVHPYTKALLRSAPSAKNKDSDLYTIPGMPPVINNMPYGDAFAKRNDNAMLIDHIKAPPMFEVTKTHYAASWLLDSKCKELGGGVE